MRSFDIIFVLPYLFSDHPSFPEGILKRSLEAEGFSVGVIETPFWQEPSSFSVLGAPNLFFSIIPGPVDSEVLNYTSARKRRREDLYQENANAFFNGYPPSIKYKIRPDQTVIVFANCIRKIYKDIPIITGGIEASLRRFAHYDFQKDQIRRSILLDSRVDLLVTGMGEKQIVAIARLAKSGAPLKETDISGTVRIAKDIDHYNNYVIIPTMEDIVKEPGKLMEATLKIESAAMAGQGVIQPHDGRFIVQHPSQPYTSQDLDKIYGYSYTRRHPSHHTVSPALRMNLFSVTSHRGCGGGCAFCSISAHEGKRVISRSVSSILNEIEGFQSHPEWKGIVSDIGGASAELYGADCTQPVCKRISCLLDHPCPVLQSKTTNPFLDLLRQTRIITGVKKIFLGSGIRYDLLLRNPELLEEILRFHSGRFLRVAPEHTDGEVLTLMRKPHFEVFESFVKLFHAINRKLGRKIELAPYVVIGHPGETLKSVYTMAALFKKLNLKTTDVQVFTPTPGTLSTAMYYAGTSMSYVPIPVEKNINALMKRKHMLTSSGME
ncbi:MAG: YgiQ family radical SAM protein [Candidatus Omnitrophota bacterium]